MFRSCAGRRKSKCGRLPRRLSKELEARHPKIITAEYRVAKRPRGRVLVDYNQNAWNRTLASVYSVRPKPAATVSTPVTWEEVERGVRIEDFTMKNVPARLKKLAICGSRCWRKRAAWTWSHSYDACRCSNKKYRADGSACRPRSCRRGPNGITSRSGMAFAASLFATARASICNRNRASR